MVYSYGVIQVIVVECEKGERTVHKGQLEKLTMFLKGCDLHPVRKGSHLRKCPSMQYH